MRAVPSWFMHYLEMLSANFIFVKKKNTRALQASYIDLVTYRYLLFFFFGEIVVLLSSFPGKEISN